MRMVLAEIEAEDEGGREGEGGGGEVNNGGEEKKETRYSSCPINTITVTITITTSYVTFSLLNPHLSHFLSPVPSSSGLVRILTVCAVLSQQPMYKTALLSLIQTQ